MAKSRMVNTRFWIDDYISNLDPIEKLLFLYFLTNPHTEICGIYEVPLKQIALDTGIDKEMVIKIVKRFSRDKKIVYKNGWVAIVNFAKHQLKNPKVAEGIKRGIELAPKEIRDSLCIDYDSLSHFNFNFNSNLNLNSNLKSMETSSIFSLEEKLKDMESKGGYMDIIATFIREKGLKPENSKQLSNIIARYSKVAKKMEGAYTPQQIFKGIDKIKKDNLQMSKRGDEIDWTLETILKALTK